MARILIVLPDNGFDPTEAAVPWHVMDRAGHNVQFASQSGKAATCDQTTLTGKGLPRTLKFLRAHPENIQLYNRMTEAAAYQAPSSWEAIDAGQFDGLVLPGGHDKAIRPYLESPDVHAICKSFFDRAAPVGAICHGVMALARTLRDDGKSVLWGYQTTGLTEFQEQMAIAITRPFLADHYQTYPRTVQGEVSMALQNRNDFKTGWLTQNFGSSIRPDAGFVVTDRHYVSARWPGDAWKFAFAFEALVRGL